MRADQRGFTLVELLVSLAVSGMLLAGLVAAIFQVTRYTDSNSTTITAVNQIETAARSIASDVQMARTHNLAEGTPVSLDPAGIIRVNLSWTDYTTWTGSAKPDQFQSYSATYYLSGSDLLRDFNDGVTLTTRTIARHIDSIEFTLSSLSSGVVTVDIVSAPRGDAYLPEQRTYYIDLRPVGESALK